MRSTGRASLCGRGRRGRRPDPALAVALAVALAAVLGGCAHPERPGAAPTTTTVTSAADDGRSGSRQLWVERRDGSECSYAAPVTITFADDGAALDAASTDAIEKWASCLTSPRLEGATIEIDAPLGALSAQRAARIAGALERRGVSAPRVVVVQRIGPPATLTVEVKPMHATPDVRMLRPVP